MRISIHEALTYLYPEGSSRVKFAAKRSPPENLFGTIIDIIVVPTTAEWAADRRHGPRDTDDPAPPAAGAECCPPGYSAAASRGAFSQASTSRKVL